MMQVLSRMPDTSACIGHPLILPYIHRLYSLDIAPMAQQLGIDPYVYTLDVFCIDVEKYETHNVTKWRVKFSHAHMPRVKD